MRILIAAENPFERKEIRALLRELPFEKWDDTMSLSILDESPSQGSIMFVLAGHPKGNYYDLVIAANDLKKGTGLQLTKILGEKEVAPAVPFIIYGVGREGAAGLPETTCLLPAPIAKESLAAALEKIALALIRGEDARRKAAIEKLMQKLASGERVANFPSQLENIYIRSVANILHLRKYAPWHVASHLSLVNIYMGCNKYESAIPHAKTALRIDPDNREAHRQLALAYRRAGKSFEELGELLEMLKNDPSSSDILLKVGEAYLRAEDYPKAEEFFIKAINAYSPEEENRGRAKLHVGLGRAYAGEAAQGQNGVTMAMARDEFNAAIHLYPLLLSAYNNLILVYRKLGQYEEAMKIVGLAADITPDNAEDWVALFEIFLIDGDQKKARFCLHKALKYDPENQITLCTAAETYVRQGLFEDAVGLFEKAVEVNPSDSRLYNFLGICSRQLNQYDLAIGYYHHALKLDPDDPGLHHNLGAAYRHIGDLAKARAEYETALRLQPDFTEAAEALKRLAHTDVAG
ncbi:MAG: tetratricopeptide repeat protein [Nitrospinae bacterium]|nr:tetratricopeptide repeat protein [Nitrospinota bacterium]